MNNRSKHWVFGSKYIWLNENKIFTETKKIKQSLEFFCVNNRRHEESEKGNMRLFIINQCLVSNIFGSMIECYLEVIAIGVGDSFWCVSPIHLLPSWSAKKEEFTWRPWIWKWESSYRIQQNKIVCNAMGWILSHHM